MILVLDGQAVIEADCLKRTNEVAPPVGVVPTSDGGELP